MIVQNQAAATVAVTNLNRDVVINFGIWSVVVGLIGEDIGAIVQNSADTGLCWTAAKDLR